jgi:hypothetical protein
MDATKKVVSRDPEVMGGELVFAGTRVEVKTLIDYLKAGHTLDDFLEGFPTVSRGLCYVPGSSLPVRVRVRLTPQPSAGL